MARCNPIPAAALIAALSTALCGCSKPQYDTSSPQSALDSMYQMIADGHPEMLSHMLYIEPRDITYSDGVTEASAIENVTDKAGDMLGQLYRVAQKLRGRYPADVNRELNKAHGSIQKAARGEDPDFFGRFMTDPFGLMDQQRQRITVQDLGDGTAAILIDGKPAFGLGLQMREVGGVDGGWKIDVPIELLQEYRPNTREEWSVIANMMLSLERALTQFEVELDRGDFRDLQQAGNRAGRLLGERGFVQAIIYQTMKKRPPARDQAATQPATASGF